jgi:hypothetical protein
MNLREHLRLEFRRRVERNPRYSLRAFARALEVHHSTLSRTLEGARGFSDPFIRHLGHRLRLPEGAVQQAIAFEHARKVLAAIRSRRGAPNVRRIATVTGLGLDDVNRALHWLIHTRRLEMRTATAWVVIQP